MAVLLFTSDEPLYLPRYLDPVLAEHGDRIREVVVAPPGGTPWSQVRRQFRMFGPRAFLRMGARFAASRALGMAPPRTQRRLTGRYHSVPSVAAAHGVPTRHVRDVTDPGFVESVRERDPDLVLSVVCGQKLPPAVLDVPERAINVHGSLLPRYRGRATAFWPLYHGDEEAGVTAHEMTDVFDAGPIVARQSFPLAENDTLHDVYLKISDVGGSLAVDVVERFPDDLDPRPNPTTPADYRTLPTPAERREFRRRGNEFL